MDDATRAGPAQAQEIAHEPATGSRGESEVGTSTRNDGKPEEKARTQLDAEVSATVVERWKDWFVSWMLYLDEQLAELFGLNRSRYEWEIEEKKYRDWLAEQRLEIPTTNPIAGETGHTELPSRDL